MGEKHLSEVIDMEKDIMPYRLIQIYSGVGSGKNYWVSSLASQGYKILFITSRRAVADAQAFSMGLTQDVNLGKLKLGEDGKSLHSVVCTNARIESFAKRQFCPEDEQTYIWNFFDFIILDEAHSLVTDASFCDSPFHVKQFLLRAYRSDANCKVILMTGTPEPIDWLISEETRKSEGFNQLDFYNDCIHVDPGRVCLFPYHAVVEAIADKLNEGENRIIYFANSIKRIKAIVDELQSRGIPESDIGITYSKRDKDEAFSPALTEKIDRIRDSIVQKGSIPEDIRILITTAQNREGVNIHDEDIKIMVAESTTRSELVQMAGRVRSGLDLLVVAYGGPSYGDTDTQRLAEQIDRKCVKDVNAVFDEFQPSFGSNWDDLISFVEGRFTYMRFDYFTLEFKFYAGKVRGSQQARYDREELSWYINRLEHNVGLQEEECRRAEAVEKWFPCLQVERSYERQDNSTEQELRSQVDNLIDNVSADCVITKEQRDTLLDGINELLQKYGKKTGKTLGPVLKRFGYYAEPEGKHDGQKWIIRRGEKT